MDDVVDGNAVAGVLSEIFRAEMTVTITTCATCGDTRPVGALRAYLDAPGVVLRCASCGATQIKVVPGTAARLAGRARRERLRVPAPRRRLTEAAPHVRGRARHPRRVHDPVVMVVQVR